jgi:23S rRNA U2552 (ribose-2'-O)-methylase RlmE/FtsJ
MTYFIIPHIHTTILPSSIKIKFDNKNISSFYINPSLSKYLSNVKEEIDNHSFAWDSMKKFTNPYEFIHTNIPHKSFSISRIKPISRAFFKLIEILNTFKLLKTNKVINSFHLAEGPGGFIEALKYYRRNCINDTYIGMTLIDNENKNIPGWKKCQNFLKKNKNVIIDSGITGNGDLFRYENLKYCMDKYANSMDFITGDGGFDFSINFNQQEQLAVRIIFTQIAYAITMQNQGGTFILKIFDIFHKTTLEMVYLLSCLYKKIFIIKPNTSRSANSEKYIVCIDFKYKNTNALSIKMQSILKIFEDIDFDTYNISSIINIPTHSFFLNQIKEINSILGTQQIENILNTIKLINKTDKKKEKIESVKENNIQRCVKWCIKNNIPFNNYDSTSNIFLTH